MAGFSRQQRRGRVIDAVGDSRSRRNARHPNPLGARNARATNPRRRNAAVSVHRIVASICYRALFRYFPFNFTMVAETELTLRPNRRRYLLNMTLAAGFVAAGALTIRKGDPRSWAAILFFGFGVIVFGLSLLPGRAYLKLDPTGFTVWRLFRAHST